MEHGSGAQFPFGAALRICNTPLGVNHQDSLWHTRSRSILIGVSLGCDACNCSCF
jgi:hypothetical protein